MPGAGGAPGTAPGTGGGGAVGGLERTIAGDVDEGRIVERGRAGVAGDVGRTVLTTGERRA